MAAKAVVIAQNELSDGAKFILYTKKDRISVRYVWAVGESTRTFGDKDKEGLISFIHEWAQAICNQTGVIYKDKWCNKDECKTLEGWLRGTKQMNNRTVACELVKIAKALTGAPADVRADDIAVAISGAASDEKTNLKDVVEMYQIGKSKTKLRIHRSKKKTVDVDVEIVIKAVILLSELKRWSFKVDPTDRSKVKAIAEKTAEQINTNIEKIKATQKVWNAYEKLSDGLREDVDDAWRYLRHHEGLPEDMDEWTPADAKKAMGVINKIKRGQLVNWTPA